MTKAATHRAIGWWILIAVGLLLAWAGTARAGGYALADQSAVAGGTGGASTARADDAGAAWYNPAALADGAGLRIGLGVMAAMPSVSAESMDGAWSSETESGISTPPHLHASFAHDQLVYGVSAGVPFGGGVTWPEDWAGRHEIIASRLEVLRIAPFVGFRWEKLRVAGGVHVDFARMRINRSLDFVDTEGDVHIDMDGRDFGFDLAAYYDATPELAIGASYKSRGSIDVTGGADFEAPDAFNMKTADQHVATSIAIPDRIAVGGRWARDRLAVLADVETTLWGSYDELALDFENEETPDQSVTTEWGTTIGLRAGAEYAVRPGTLVRAGAFYDPSPAPDENLAPSSPDANRLGGSIGVSHTVREDVAVDAFYTFMKLLSREAGGSENLAARYGGHAQFLGLGVRLHR